MIPEVSNQAVRNALNSGKSNGYPPSIGVETTRIAVASYYSTPESLLSFSDVIIASGCSDALNLCIGKK